MIDHIDYHVEDWNDADEVMPVWGFTDPVPIESLRPGLVGARITPIDDVNVYRILYDVRRGETWYYVDPLDRGVESVFIRHVTFAGEGDEFEDFYPCDIVPDSVVRAFGRLGL